MSRGESHHRTNSATENLARLRKMKAQFMVTEGDTFILRDLAFTYGGRDLPYPQMIEHLITALVPRAITERLLQ